jgi:hypothetical protein
VKPFDPATLGIGGAYCDHCGAKLKCNVTACNFCHVGKPFSFHPKRKKPTPRPLTPEQKLDQLFGVANE